MHIDLWNHALKRAEVQLSGGNLNVETQSMVESILQSSVAAIFFVMARKKPKITHKFNELIGLDENWPIRFSQG